MRANVYISTDHSFATRTQIYDGNGTNLANNTAFVSVSGPTSPITVNDGQTLYVRVYPWYNNQATASATSVMLIIN
jgi:hypothetical protein